MQELLSLVPPQLTAEGVGAGEEMAFPPSAALNLVKIATDHGIAVLGVERFEATADGLRFENGSSYEVVFAGDWDSFVRLNNANAAQFIDQPRSEGNRLFIL